METLLSLLTDPKILALLSPFGIFAVVEGIVIYKLYQKVDELQEKRLEDAVQMNKDWIQLSQDVTKTLDLVVKIAGNKRNGNGGSN